MTIPLQIIVLLIASILTTISRLIPVPNKRLKRKQGSVHNIKILFRVPSGEDWNSILWDYMKAAFYPQQLRFGILVECSSITDAEQDVDPLLRSITNVKYVFRKQNSENQAVRRLSRHFVLGDETIVIIVDNRIRFRTSFDCNIIHLFTHLDDEVLVSVPSRCTNGKGHFPCLVKQSGARNVSLPFCIETSCLIPSVCVCHEVMFARPHIFQNWSELKSIRHVTTPVPLVVNDERTESLYIESSHSSETGIVDRCKTVGIVNLDDEEERILKFGTAHAGKLAVKFGYESITDAI
jgi:hypothetical protein